MLDGAGRPRPSPGGRRQRGGGLTGAGIADARASHLQPQRPGRGSAERAGRGSPRGGRCPGRREACSPGRWDAQPSRDGRDICGSGQGPTGEGASRPQVSAAGLGARSAPGRASAWRGPALCQPRAAGTRTHPRGPGFAGAPLPHRGASVGGRGREGLSGREPGEVPVAHRAYGLGSGLGAWARAPATWGLME